MQQKFSGQIHFATGIYSRSFCELSTFIIIIIIIIVWLVLFPGIFYSDRLLCLAMVGSSISVQVLLIQNMTWLKLMR
jgi:hypothetical protein